MLMPLIGVGIFVTVVLLFEGLCHLVRSRSKYGKDQELVKVRLQSWVIRPDLNGPSELIKKRQHSEIPWLNRTLTEIRKWSVGTQVSKWHSQAQSPYSLGVYTMASGLLAVVGGLLGSMPLFGQPFILFGSAVIGLFVPWGILYYQKYRRLNAFYRQFPDALELMARALRAGHALFVGMKMVGGEMRDPVAGEFQQGFDELSMGASVPEALHHLAERVDLIDVRFFVTAVNIQRQTGGNLAEIIDSLGRLIRKRFELKKRIYALSAEGRLSAAILIFLPFGMGGVLHIVSPEYLTPLFVDPIGQSMVVGGMVMMLAGAIVMKRMIAIKA